VCAAAGGRLTTFADGIAEGLCEDLRCSIPEEDGGPPGGGKVFPIELLQEVRWSGFAEN